MGYAESGTPRVVLNGDPDDAPEVLRTVLDAVEPGDLSPTAAACWKLLRVGKLPELPEWAVTYGMGIAFYAPVAARKLIGLVEAERRYRAALTEAAEAYESMARW